MTDAEKLEVLAQWFDREQSAGRWGSDNLGFSVQNDLRRIARVLRERAEGEKSFEGWFALDTQKHGGGYTELAIKDIKREAWNAALLVDFRAALREMQWRPIDDEARSGKAILCVYHDSLGREHNAHAKYIPRFTEQVPFSDDNAEYCEEKDEYFTSEGWYEICEAGLDYNSWKMDYEPTLYMNIPAPPAQNAAQLGGDTEGQEHADVCNIKAAECRMCGFHDAAKHYEAGAAAILANAVLRAEVREWLCSECNTVYPGPPTQGLDCVICPECGGTTAPRLTVENAALRQRVKGLQEALHHCLCVMRYPDNGHHYCRSCSAGTNNNWQHDDYCVINNQCKEVDKARDKARRALAEGGKDAHTV